MTDYERDMRHWQNAPEDADLNGCNPMPNRKDYDEHGNKIGTKYTSAGRVIDPYLVATYGMEYAIKNANMTREEQITRKAGSIADGCIAHGAPWKEYHQGFIEGAKWADTNPSQPSLPSNIDEAANKFAVSYDQGTCDGIAQDCFKAGAEWMAAQGTSFNTKVGWIDGPTILDWPDDILDKFEMGEEVIVQIRKIEEESK